MTAIPRVLLTASKTGYQVREFYGAAERLGVELILVTDRCHVLEDPWGDRAVALQFDQPAAGIEGLERRGPFDGIVAVGDKPAAVAAEIAKRLNLRFHPPDAVRAASDKYITRELLRTVGLNIPAYSLLDSGGEASSPRWRYPCVLKPLHLSASRGVIRADSPKEFSEAFTRIRKMTGEEPVLVEDFIPGSEFALEGIVTSGHLQTLAIFDKPDPLDGPFFEETIYLTPSREPPEAQRAMESAVQIAICALGLTHGSVHAEMRVNGRGVWMLEAAARPIGGLCSRVLRFEPNLSFEELLLQHALGRDISAATLAPGAHGVMMIPIPRAGIYSGVDGLEQARKTADIEAVEITAKEGQHLEPLPEGQSYLGFIFSRAESQDNVERALRQAHACLTFRMAHALPVVR